jgi:hypothetical protein
MTLGLLMPFFLCLLGCAHYLILAAPSLQRS